MEQLNLNNRPRYEQLDDIGGMQNIAVQAWGSNVDAWFEGFEKRQRELLAQLVTIASNNADSVISLGNEKFELSRAERYGIILYIRKELLGE
jgi:hypothetical protein